MKLINLSRVVFMLSFILLAAQFSYGQKKENKTNMLIDSFGFVESIKERFLDDYIEPLKLYVTNEDRDKLTEIENLLTDEEIRKRVTQAFNEFFTKKEIDELYSFVTSSAYDKLYKSPISIADKVLDPFEDITEKLDRIAEKIELEAMEEEDSLRD